MSDTDFQIEFSAFNEGFAPLAHLDTTSFVGNKGQATEMKADIISKPGFLTQSPALADLTNGTQAGVVDQLIRFILDKPISTSTYAIGTTKLFKLSSTTVTSGGSPSWPQAITDMTSGESVIRLGANIYGFFNKASGGDILKMPISSEVIDPDWGSSTDAALQGNVPHPSAVKEDVMLFGNGQYVGVYIDAGTLDVDKLDFGAGAEVADIVFSANFWWIAVNYGEGKRSQVYVYDGSALSNILSDEVGIGDQQIGFLYVHNGIIYVAYSDESATGFTIGWIKGRRLEPLRYFGGTLPDHRQKALYKNTIIFNSSTDIYSFGSSVGQLPLQISKLADGGHATLGGIASPFGTPMIASTDGASNHRLAKFSGYSTDSSFKSVWVDTSNGRMLGKVHTMIVKSKVLGANARCDIKIEGNQGAETDMTALEYSGTGTRRKVFKNIILPQIEDVRVVVDYANGNATNDCPIRSIILQGNFVER